MHARAPRLFALLLLALACQAAQAFDLVDSAGQRHSLAAYRGRWVLVNLWATWCAPCVDELPDLQALAERHPGLVVLGVEADGKDPRRALQFAAKLGARFPQVTGPEGVARQFGARAYPTTLLYDPQGRLHRRIEGRIAPAEVSALLQAAGG